MKPYNKRTWLNPAKSDSTGSVIAFDGKITDFEGKEYDSTFLEIADCSKKIRLHKVSDDSKEDFIAKMELLKSEINQFIEHLKKKKINNRHGSKTKITTCAFGDSDATQREGLRH